VIVDVDRFDHPDADRAAKRQLESILREPGPAGVAAGTSDGHPPDPVTRVDEAARVHAWRNSVQSHLVPGKNPRIMIEQSLPAAFCDRAVGIRKQNRIPVMDEVLAMMRIDVQVTWPHSRERPRSIGCGGFF
jgi:hypothetical protein